MLATLKIRKLGFPVRYKHQAFHDRYRVLDVSCEDHESLVESIKASPEYAEAHENRIDSNPIFNDDVIIGDTMVMMRDDLARVLNRKRNTILEASCVIAQAAYRASNLTKEFTAKRRDAALLQPIIRSTLASAKYLPKKWTKLDREACSGLSLVIRASMARNKYYAQRIQFFEGANRQHLIQLVVATVKRQEYYDRKLKAMEQEQVMKEMEKFEIYDLSSKTFMEEWGEEKLAEEEERPVMYLEDDYVNQLLEARAMEIIDQEKGNALLDAEEWYRRAAAATRKYREEAANAGDFEDKLSENAAELELGAHKKIYMMLKQKYDALGMTELYPYPEARAPDNLSCCLVAPPLRPLPSDTSSLVMMKRYVHKATQPPKRDLDEGFEFEQLPTDADKGDDEVVHAGEAPAEGQEDGPEEEGSGRPPIVAGAEPVQTGVELELSVDPSTLSEEEQMRFVNELAKMMGVDPSTLSISTVVPGEAN